MGEGQIRCDDLHVSKKTSSCRQPHSGDGQTIRESPLLPGNSRSEKLHSLLPRPAGVPPAHFGGRKSARRGCRGRRGTRGLIGWRQCARGNVPLLSDAAIVPSMVGNAVTRREAETLMCGAFGQWSWKFYGRGAGACAFTCCGW